MSAIDNAILDTSNNITNNISRFDASERGLLSQNILSQLRNLVEYTMIKIYATENNMVADPNDYDNMNKKAVSFFRKSKQRTDISFITKFHSLLQKSVSHYTIDENGSERLMLKYYEYLIMLKGYLKSVYGLTILDNIEDFPLNTDPQLSEYYTKISEKIETPNYYTERLKYNDRYYIQKIKPFFVNGKIYYEVTFTAAFSTSSKFDRMIAFTKINLTGNYAVKLSVRKDQIDILDRSMPIQIIDSWIVSIRPCEITNFGRILGYHQYTFSQNSPGYNELMSFLTRNRISLTDIVDSSEEYYEYVKSSAESTSRSTRLFQILDSARDIIINNKPGSNILRYLLYTMNNRIIRKQFYRNSCDNLSGLYLKYGCIPFDEMPYNSSLISHNPRIYDLYDCIPVDNREHELLARKIRNNTEIEGILFTPVTELTGFENVTNLVNTYNSKLYYKHTDRQLMIFKDCLYIKGYADDSANIVKELKRLASSGIVGYSNSVQAWLNSGVYNIDSDEKRDALSSMFSASHVAVIYGAAGTGKSTMINHISAFFSNKKKRFLANTHPAVTNMRRKVLTAGSDSDFKTIKSFISDYNTDVESDILIIDECSTVSNADMWKVLSKAKYELLILVGDIYQIEAISFGNWFTIAKAFIPNTSVFELTSTFRSTNKMLLTVWDRVRVMDIAVLEPIVKSHYSIKLDESIFEKAEQDQIILCLNYDGLYGINNVNRLLQNSNPNTAFEWATNIYKINDPILFNESDRFSPLIHNNMKGRIVDIQIIDRAIQFDIEIDTVLNEFDVSGYAIELVGYSSTGKSIIRFSVNQFQNSDEDDDTDNSTVVPFQVAYAVSIHKAQGLEYDSVKIIITNESEERITHNIFYTAITRTKDKLSIYWSPETENAILKEMVPKNPMQDVGLLRAKYPHLNN